MIINPYLQTIVSPPVNTVANVISGVTAVGQYLTTDNGTWTNTPSAYSYQWKRDGSPISGETNYYYTTTFTDVSTTITCTVTASNSGGSGTVTGTGVAITLYNSDETAIKNLASTFYLFNESDATNYINSAPSNFVTLSGSSGTANININGTNYLATFATNLFTTASNFVSTHSAALTALGIQVYVGGVSSTGVITIVGLTGSATITNASGTLNGTVSNGAVSAATRPTHNANGITFSGSTYFPQPLTPVRTVITVQKVANTATGFLWRGINNSSNQVAISVSGTGTVTLVSDIRRNGAVVDIANAAAIDDNAWSISTFITSSAINTGAVYYGATNTGTSILSAGEMAAVMTFNFVLTQKQIQDVNNYIVKTINSRGLGLTLQKLPTLVTTTATNASGPINLPAVYGSTQDEYNMDVHPKVLDMEIEKGAGQTWGGYRYWMANTPFGRYSPTYTTNPDFYENPCIFASTDGTTWVTPSGVTNPIFPNPGNNGYGSDIHLMYVPSEDRVYYYWREYNSNADTQDHCVCYSTNGFATYSSKIVMFTKTNILSNSANNYLSPVVFYDPYLLKYVMYGNRFYKDSGIGRNVFSRCISDTPTGFTGTFTDGTMPASYFQLVGGSVYTSPWHFDIIPDTRVNNSNSRGYVAFPSITTTGDANGTLYLIVLTSVDGMNWQMPRNITMSPNFIPAGTNWDGDRIYRPSAVKSATGWDIYYSAFGFPYINGNSSYLRPGTGKTTLLLP